MLLSKKGKKIEFDRAGEATADMGKKAAMVKKKRGSKEAENRSYATGNH